jgi:hypothetical protein
VDKFMAKKAFVNRIEVGDTPQAPQVVRDGKFVKALHLDEERVNALVDRLQPPTRFQVARVVTQSVPSGTLVQRGTVVDLTMVRPIDIRYEVFGEVHPQIRTRSVAQILEAMPAAITQIIANKEDPTTLNSDEHGEVNGFLQKIGIQTTSEGGGSESFPAVYNLLVNSQVFR